MTTKQYVKKYRLDDKAYSNHFNTDLFLQDLNEEFLGRIAREKQEREKTGAEYSFKIFNIIIQEIQNKFCAISNKKVGGPLRKELWNAFYAKYIVQIRATDFPKEHQEIQVKRELYEKKKIREAIIKELEPYYTVIKGKANNSEEGAEAWALLKEKLELEVERRFNANK